MKPDAAAYGHVIERIGCRPEEILFFDDSPECIEGAASLGIRGHVVQGLHGVLSALESEGIDMDVTRLGIESVQRAE
jgi:putative hydrolase of the HAD superfamily